MSHTNNDQRNEDIKPQAAKTTREQSNEQHIDQQTSADADQVSQDRLQDGYSLNEGSDYSSQPSNEEQQTGYDPAHSGVRHAQNKPGMRTNNPGREGQGGWAEQLQMGQTSDTPHRKNPAD